MAGRRALRAPLMAFWPLASVAEQGTSGEAATVDGTRAAAASTCAGTVERCRSDGPPAVWPGTHAGTASGAGTVRRAARVQSGMRRGHAVCVRIAARHDVRVRTCGRSVGRGEVLRCASAAGRSRPERGGVARARGR